MAVGQSSGQLLSTGDDNGLVRVWKVGRSDALGELRGSKGAVTASAFGPAEHMLGATYASGTVSLFDLPRMCATTKLRGHSAAANSVCFHPVNPAVVATCGSDAAVRLWDARSGKEYVSYKGHKSAVGALSFSPDGRWLATGADDGGSRLWDLATGKLLASLIPPRHRSRSGRDRAGGGSAAASAGTSTRAVRALAFHPTDLLLAVAGDDRRVHMWDIDLVRAPGGMLAECYPLSAGGRTMVETKPISHIRFLQPDATRSMMAAAGGASSSGEAVLAVATPDVVRMWGINLASECAASCSPTGSASPAVSDAVSPQRDSAGLSVGLQLRCRELCAERVGWGALGGLWVGRGAESGGRRGAESGGRRGSEEGPGLPPVVLVGAAAAAGGAVRVYCGRVDLLCSASSRAGAMAGASPSRGSWNASTGSPGRAAGLRSASPVRVLAAREGGLQARPQQPRFGAHRDEAVGAPAEGPPHAPRAGTPGLLAATPPGPASPLFVVESAGAGIRGRAQRLAGGGREVPPRRPRAVALAAAPEPVGVARACNAEGAGADALHAGRRRSSLREGDVIPATRHAPVGLRLRDFLPGKGAVALLRVSDQAAVSPASGTDGAAGFAAAAGKASPADAPQAVLRVLTCDAKDTAGVLEARLGVVEVASALWAAGNGSAGIEQALASRVGPAAVAVCQAADLRAGGVTLAQCCALLRAALAAVGYWAEDTASGGFVVRRPSSAVAVSGTGPPLWSRFCVALLAASVAELYGRYAVETVAGAGGAPATRSLAQEEREQRGAMLVGLLRACRSAVTEGVTGAGSAEEAEEVGAMVGACSNAVLAIDRVLMRR